MSSEPQIIKKKRGRKPKFKGNTNESWKENVVDTKTAFDKYIMCLKIKKSDLDTTNFMADGFCQYNPVINTPKPYSTDNMSSKLSLFPLDIDMQGDDNSDYGVEEPQDQKLGAYNMEDDIGTSEMKKI